MPADYESTDWDWGAGGMVRRCGTYLEGAFFAFLAVHLGFWGSLSKRVTLVRLSRMQKTIRPGKGIRFSTSYRLRVGRRQYRIPKLLGLYLNGQALTARSPERFYGNEALVDKYRAQPHFGPGEAPRRMARGEDYAAWR